MEDHNSCCNPAKIKNNGAWSGILFGLLPHIFCIGFVICSAVGALAFASFFRSTLMIPYFFQILVGISLVFATISAVSYLKMNKCLCFGGLKSKWKYLTILYSATVLINLFMFFAVFPALANMGSSKTNQNLPQNSLTLKVDIPCSGHSFLITSELQRINGVTEVEFKMPDIFNIAYDPKKTSPDKIVSLDVFKTYKATIQ